MSITTPWRWDQSGKERIPLPVAGFYTRGGAVRIRGNKIFWERLSVAKLRVNPSGLPVPYETKTFTLLQQFLALSDGATDDLRKFAERYGPLGKLKPMGGERESLEDWRHCIARARALLAIANKLQQGQFLSDQDCAMLGCERFSVGTSTARPPRELIRSLERFALINAVNQILWLWDVRPSVSWRPGSEVHLELGGPTLLSGIGALLLSAICRSDRPLLCSACGKPYWPSRKPRDGENHFCQECGKKAARRLAQRRYSQNLKLRKKGKGNE